ncbi:hypothetical protein [Parahalioglobus pacificus]|uniref:Uncharacterized protein n=1 Tax=Parahalioglobus pacificus TaxID=930806 RepID=A0A918XGM5_9GAMM|nr:hypothetical protein [Halioglobus pacificus]GHD31133.1 hypothetical protein GCM10007053_13870 [Halioglobus pacificus]
MSVTAELKVKLFAGETLVAESEDQLLWSQALAAIQAAETMTTPVDASTLGTQQLPVVQQESDFQEAPATAVVAEDDVSDFANDLGVERQQLEGALDPTKESPYIHLDIKCWEAFKSNNPSKGRNAIANSVIAATILCLWWKKVGLDGRPSVRTITKLLSNIGTEDKNPGRGITNCSWLQQRTDGVHINPAEVSKAEALVTAFVLKTALPK